MGKNVLYANEIASANKFIIEHNADYGFKTFLEDLKNPALSHSARWSLAFDYMYEHFPEDATGTLITGIAYYVED